MKWLTKKPSGLVSGHRFSDAANRLRSTAPSGAGLLALALALLAFLSSVPARAYAQEQSAASTSQQGSADAKSGETRSADTRSADSKKDNQAAPGHKSIARELAHETREAEGDDQEENANLKHAAPVQWLARKIGLSVHGAHLLALSLNFAIIAVVVIWAARKFLPGVFRNRTASIQQALQEARAASQDANRRLVDIETRLRQLDVEIGRMQSTAESEAAAEEGRIKNAAEADVRKVVLAAEQEIAAAANQARRELTNHTAGLAIALASQQIHVDSNTDQVLVRTFASGLASHPSSLGSSSDGSSQDDDNHGGKDGR